MFLACTALSLFILPTFHTTTAAISNMNNFMELSPGIQQELLNPSLQRTTDVASFTLQSCAAWCTKVVGCKAYTYAVSGKQAGCKLSNATTTTAMAWARTFVRLSTNLLAGQNCSVTNECIGRPLMTCTSGLCSCTSAGYVTKPDGTQCLPRRNRTETCVDTVQCPTTTVCLNGICNCAAGDVLLFGAMPCVSAAMTQMDITTISSYQFLYPNPRMTYANSLNLWWCFKANAGSRITATPTYVNMETCCDFVEVYEGCDTNKMMLVSYNTLNSAYARTTTGNVMGLRFRTDGSVVLDGVTIQVTVP